MQKTLLLLILFFSLTTIAQASSHKESPFLTLNPALDGTDLYAFNSYEAGREEFITLIANYYPSNPASGPNYQLFDNTALYEFFIDTDADAKEDHTFRFRFVQALKNTSGNGLSANVNNELIALPFINDASFSNTDESALGRELGYTVEYIKGKLAYKYDTTENDPEKGDFLVNSGVNPVPELLNFNKKKFFKMPEANIGSNSIADYDTYANAYIYDVALPDKKCTSDIRVFVGPRRDSFKANLAGIYDVVSKDLLAAENGAVNEFASSQVLTIALEIPKACLGIKTNDPVIGIWATSSTPARRIVKNKPSFIRSIAFSTNSYIQSSRLGNPLVNLFLVGYKDKDLFNRLQPSEDRKNDIDNYLLYTPLPSYIASKTSLSAPTLLPRTDLEQAFLTGFAGLNKSSKTKAKSAEILRLNTATPALAKGAQNRLGFIAGDNAGYPNGRRPGDDVVDIFLRLLFGSEINDNNVAPSGELPLTDGVIVSDQDFSAAFPYLLAP